MWRNTAIVKCYLFAPSSSFQNKYVYSILLLIQLQISTTTCNKTHLKGVFINMKKQRRSSLNICIIFYTSTSVIKCIHSLVSAYNRALNTQSRHNTTIKISNKDRKNHKAFRASIRTFRRN
jgi:hypothetical protein